MVESIKWNFNFGSAPESDPLEIAAKSRWLSKLRWIAIVAQIVCLWPGLKTGLLLPQDAAPYLIVVGLLIAFNLIGDRLFKTFKLDGESALLVQLGVDLVALASLLSLSRGCSNPMIALFYLHAAIGPLLLTGLRNIVFLAITCTALVVVCFSSMPMVHGPDGLMLPRWMRLSSELAVVCIVWQLTTWLSAYLMRLRSSVLRLEKQKSQVDNLRALGAMAASFSHEFATPLNTIKVRLDRIKRHQPDLSNNSDLMSALNGVEQCEGVLKSLFGANPDCGSVQFEKVAIADFVEAACEKWNNGQSDTAFSFRSGESARQVRCKIPSIILARSIIDLLDNAREASLSENASIDVTVSVAGKEAIVEVADRGPGISADIRKQLGSPFVSTKKGGTGLGLFSAYALAEALGGALNIRDRQGGGAIVGLAIPIAEGGL